MKRAILGALFALLSPSLAHAVDVQTLKAARGEDVWYVEDHTLPMIAISVAFPAGSAYDPDGKAGLAAFAAALLDEGAGNMNGTAFHTAISDRAIRLSASPDRDYLVVSMVTLSANARDAFHLLGLALSKPRFDEDAVSRVRAQMLSNLKQDDEDPGTVAAKGFFHAVFPDHPYGHPVTGDAAGIASIDVNDLKGFAATHWVRAGLKISVAGDADPATMKALLASAFGALPATPPPPFPPVTHMGPAGVQVIPMPVPQPTAVFGLPGIVRADRDFIPGYVANYILGGGGFSSRLTNEVRVKLGLTYDISTELSAYRRGGLVLGEVASKKGSMRQTIDVVRATMKKFIADGPTDKEMADAKTYLTGSFPLAFSSDVGIAAQLNAFQQAGLSVDYVEKRNALINAVTAADVKRVSNRLFNPARLTIVIGGSLGPADAPAKPAH
jgi:zinc protease